MTVSSTIRKAGPFAGNNAATTFPFSFKVFAKGDVKVLLVNPNGLATALTLDSDYSVLLNANQDSNPGGWVTYPISGNPLASGYQLVTLGDLAYDQETDITNQGGFYPSVIEDMSDRSTIQIQQLAEITSRAIVYSEAESASPVLPNAQARANSLVGFDASGNLELYGLSPAVGAGDLRNEAWTGGQDFTAGTSTSVTLSRAYGTKANLGTVVMAGLPQDPASYSLTSNGTVLQFDGVIPLGVTRIWCVGGTTLSIYTPPAGSVTEAMLAVGSRMASRVKDFVSVRDSGCVLDGTTDASAELIAAIAAIGSRQCGLLIAGPLLTSQAITFPPNITPIFMNDGCIIGKAGTELIQTQSQPGANRVQIFKNCVYQSTVPVTVYPEWTGALPANADNRAALQAALDAIRYTGGVVDFDAQTYNMSANINIGTGTGGSTGQNIVLRGKGRNLTKLNFTIGTASGIQIVGADGTPLQGVEIRNLSITKSPAATGGVGIYGQYTSLLHISDVTISGFIQGVGALRDGNLICERVIVILSGSVNGQRGFNLDGGGASAGGNASAELERCYVDGSQIAPTSTGHIGFYAFGAYVSDLKFSNCETQMPYGIGMELDMSTSANTGNEDVQLLNCRFDSTNTYGLYINGAGTSGSSDSMVTVIGGWVNSRSTLAETDSVFLNNCRGISIIGMQFYCAAGAAFGTHVKMANCVNVLVSGCLFSEMKYGVYMTGSGYSAINSNRFYSSSGTPATNMIVGGTCSRVMTNGNVFDGYCNSAVVNFDGASVGCGVTGSSFNASTLINTPRISNGSSGPVGGSDGSSGLNSGV